MTFEKALHHVLKIEGGYVNNPKDPGGETNFGISKRAYPSLDVARLTLSDASAIYQKDFWDALRLDEFPARLRLTVFDCAVNQGKRFAMGALQVILGVKADGVLGEDTLKAIQAADSEELYKRFMLRRFEAYARNPLWKVFGAGWGRRLLETALNS